MPTGRTAIEMTTQGGGAAARDGAQHAPLMRGHAALRLEEASAVLANDVGHLEGWPGHRFCSLRDRRAVSGAAIAIASNGLATACRCRRERCR